MSTLISCASKEKKDHMVITLNESQEVGGLIRSGGMGGGMV